MVESFTMGALLGATRCIVGCNTLNAFDHHVATCCDVLRHVRCCWFKFENGQIFHATFVDVA